MQSTLQATKRRPPSTLRRIITVVLFVVAGLFLIAVADLIVALQHPADMRYMERYVISPIPSTMVHVATLQSFHPTLGDGYCSVAYTMTEQDFEKIVSHGKLPRQGGMEQDSEERERRAKMFQKVWPAEKGDLESYFLGGNSQDGIMGRVEIIASPDHTKAVFFISVL